MAETVEWTRAHAASHVRVPAPADDKYSRGVVGLRTGSCAYPGAAVLGVEGAWRAGAGMVRWRGPADVGRLVLARRPETVLADGRAGAWVIGSGTDAASRTPIEREGLRALLAGVVPVVVDAGALDLAVEASAPLVVTPHERELARLRDALGLGPASGDRGLAATETAARLGHVVLLKGFETLVAAPDGRLLRVNAATPWLATAGAGDVLAGLLGALVAASGPGADLVALAATAAWLHGRAAVIASGAGIPHGESAGAAGRTRPAPAGHPIVALDVAEALPLAIADALTK